jgi:SAM-dependent methyltransferase
VTQSSRCDSYISLRASSTPHCSFLEQDVSLTEDVQDAFAECYAATTSTVNGQDDEAINEILCCLNSPAPQAYFVLQRALNENIKTTRPQWGTERLLSMLSCLLKQNYRFAIRSNSASGGEIKKDGSDDCELDWNIVPRKMELKDGWRHVLDDYGNHPFQSTLEIAHSALELATQASERDQPVNPIQLEKVVDTAIHRLEWTLGQDIPGRRSADAAFCFAMAGVVSPRLYRMLATIAQFELTRMGQRPSLASQIILQMVEKLAAAGLQGPDMERLYQVAADLLDLKGEKGHSVAARALRSGSFGLHSDRPLLWLWRFSARQSKVKIPKVEMVAVLSDAIKTELSPRWIDRLENPSLPLIVDVGCGMGVSLLGLATSEELVLGSIPSFTTPNLTYRNCNLVGCDLSHLVIGNGRGIAEQWKKVENRLQFVCQSAESLLQDIQSFYPGPVQLLMIQFPTPFRLIETTDVDDESKDPGSSGNSQLAESPGSGFMASTNLFQYTSTLLKPSNGCLLLQSNCEDVAVVMRKMASQERLACLSIPFPVLAPPLEHLQAIPQRTHLWIQLGGERAIGPGWSSKPLLPRLGQTETEVACELQGTPVHRCVLGTRLPEG